MTTKSVEGRPAAAGRTRELPAAPLQGFASAAGNWPFVLPALLINCALLLFPLLFTFFLAFTSWEGVGDPTWTGFENFFELFRNPDFWLAAGNNLKWTAIFLTLPIALALFTAATLLERKHLRWLQAVFLLPYILPTVVKARIWQGMVFNPESGLFGWLTRHGISLQDPLAQTSTSLYAIAIVDMWAWWGFLTVVFFAAMRQLNRDLLDAARIDGANFFHRLLLVQIPLIRPTLTFMLIMTIVWSFLVFDYIYVLTNGGPAGSSEVLSTLAYKYAFERFEFGKAACTSTFTGILSIVVLIFYSYLQRREHQR